MATGDRICPYCGQYQCICGKVLRSIIRTTFPKLDLPEEEERVSGTKGKAVKPGWRVYIFPSPNTSDYITVYAYNIHICEDERSVVADGVKVDVGARVVRVEEKV